jgi:hypothetical protein
VLWRAANASLTIFDNDGALQQLWIVDQHLQQIFFTELRIIEL